MIPNEFVREWGQKFKWSSSAMIEHDLVISKALVCLYSDPIIQDKLLFRGGTALNKLHINPASRYSEDIDFVQRDAEPIGPIMSAIRIALDGWLGKPQRKFTEYGVKIIYRYEATSGMTMRLKLEINTLEHSYFRDLHYQNFDVDAGWFTGSALVTSYKLEELMATKLRALYQRRKGRDLFDAYYVFGNNLTNMTEVINLFNLYCQRAGSTISGKAFSENMEQKRVNRDFRQDISPLLPEGVLWNFDEAFEFVQSEVISKIP